MEFSRQKYWSELLFPSPGIFPTQGSSLGLPHCKQLPLPSEPPGKLLKLETGQKLGKLLVIYQVLSIVCQLL